MKALWIVLLVGFAALNVYSFATSDVGALLEFLANLGPWGSVAIADLLIAITIALAWMWRDAGRRGVNPLPYVLVTVLTGSIGVLIYLVRYWDQPLEA